MSVWSRWKGPRAPDHVLRVGIAQGGRIVAERLVRPGRPVTIGEDTANTFVMKARGLGRRYTLFEARRGRYALRLSPAFGGRLAMGTDVVDLGGGGGRTVPLDPDARGKIVLDDITVLFQFVDAPPESARLARADFRPRFIDDDDPVFLGFVGLWSAVASVLVIYAFSVEPHAIASYEEIPDRFAHYSLAEVAPPPEVEEMVLVEDDGPALTVVETRPAEVAEVVERSSPERAPESEEDRIERRREEVYGKSRVLQLIGSTGENTRGTVFSSDDPTFGEISDNLDASGIYEVASVESMALRGPEDRTGRDDVTIEGLSRRGYDRAEVDEVRGSGPSRRAIEGSVTQGPTQEADDRVRAALKDYRRQVKACYERRLKEIPTMAGRFALEVDIVGGQVTRASAAENGTGDRDLEDCILARARRWSFPSDISRELYLPFALEPM